MRRCFLLCALAVLCVLCAAPALAAPGGKRGDTWRDPLTRMEFVWVPGGALKQNFGPAARDPYFGDDPERLPWVAGFWLGRFEVTQGQWRKVMGRNPAFFTTADAFPVEQVSLADVREYIARLNAKGAAKFRLPTQREWEYAARSGGRTETYAGGDEADRAAWHKGNSGGATHQGGAKAPNGLGLHDMSGNVWEWCGGDLSGGASSAQAQESLSFFGDMALHTYCGGGWNDEPVAVHEIKSGLGRPDFRRNDIGLRLVRVP